MIKWRVFGRGTREASAPPPPAAEPQIASEPEVPLNGKTVLVVDDDPVFVKATSTQLRSAGYNVKSASDSSEAINVISEQRMDAVLMDLEFAPDVAQGRGAWDGFQLMYWLRGMPGAQGARFIVISVSDSEAHRAKARKFGAVAYFQKPAGRDELIAALEGRN